MPKFNSSLPGPNKEKAETHRVSHFERQVARTKYWNHWIERKKPRNEHYFQKLLNLQ